MARVPLWSLLAAVVTLTLATLTWPGTQRPAIASAPAPPMGFNDWNAFGCDVDDQLIRETADAMVADGMAAAGYRYVNIDDCWSLKDRDASGRLIPDPTRFPYGMKALADYVHARGLKLGIYGDAGTQTCAGYPGSLGHERIDAQTWARWGIDYLKYDNCFNNSDGSRADYTRRYTTMASALRATGRPILYSICEWGTAQPWTWAAGVGQLWRTTDDITDTWSSVKSIIDLNTQVLAWAGPGHWNDPDMLEVGNGGMTETEYRTHMGMWAMMAAPLIAGTDLRSLSASALAILTDRDVIAIDQDPLGAPAVLIGPGVYARPLTGGDQAVALYNSSDTPAVMTAPITLPAAPAYRLHDVWTGLDTTVTGPITVTVPAHGAAVLRVHPLLGPMA
ncbi:glycoside hydrolase family 27 protein [Actinoplanes sp. HUAS TT8]|uniref:glycoside hydrolase family 27 protein n=1 Tax=Actinoplanes sp. HUAS TT8 TaxID=3447453 RepID=UPI003F528B1E